jgi:hypothetical protein
MAFRTINIGTTANARDGDSLRTAFSKINTNFTELYALAEIGLREWIFVEDDYFANNGDRVIVNTSGGPVTVTLPEDPEIGNYIQIADGWNFAVNNLIVVSERTVEGFTEDIIVNIRGLYIEFIYGDGTWKLLTSLGVQGPPGPPGPGGIMVTNIDGGSAVTLFSGSDLNIDGGSASTVFDSTNINLDGGGA